MEYVDKQFIERDLKNMDSVRNWYLTEWPSPDLFFEMGFGHALVDEKEETIVKAGKSSGSNGWRVFLEIIGKMPQ
ncbi:MAG: hypothetical protein ACE5OZ_13535 [Candidatus Heimdallarchaeota archaeon]